MASPPPTTLSSAIAVLNAQPAADCETQFLTCCGSREFAAQLTKRRPFASEGELREIAAHVWNNEVSIPGRLQAFSAHPRIGSSKPLSTPSSKAGEDGPGGGRGAPGGQHQHQQQHYKWSEGEQAAAQQTANPALTQELAEWNAKYEAKFGHVFLICAQGRPAQEILQQLKLRYGNPPLVELQNACLEQQKITDLRLLKLLAGNADAAATQGSAQTSPLVREQVSLPRISTHVLDTVLGRPGAGIAVALEQKQRKEGAEDAWVCVGRGGTNADGRCGTFQPVRCFQEPSSPQEPLLLRLCFTTGEYFTRVHKVTTFFPEVFVVFQITPPQRDEKFHVPLLLTPYSYSTYRGS